MDAENIVAYLTAMGEPEMAQEVATMHNRLEAFSDGLNRDCLQAAVLAERELCAKTVEAEAQRNVTKFGPEYEKQGKAEAWAMLQAAHAIRERSNAIAQGREHSERPAGAEG